MIQKQVMDKRTDIQQQTITVDMTIKTATEKQQNIQHQIIVVVMILKTIMVKR